MLTLILARILRAPVVVALALLTLPYPLRASPAADAVRAARDPAWRQRAAAALSASVDRVTLAALDAPASPGAPCEMALPIAGEVRMARLAPHTIRGPRFRVRVQAPGGAWRDEPAPPPATWRGVVEGAAGSRVIASHVAGEWRMSVTLANEATGADETWSVAPLRTRVAHAPAGVSLVVRTADLPPETGTCGVAAAARAPAPATREQGEAVQALSPVEVRVCEVACDADSEFWALNGSSVAATVADIEAVLDGASEMWERDLQLAFQLGTILVRTTEPDPYTTANPDGLLGQVRTDWRTNHTDVPRDVVHMFTGRDLTGSAVGIAYTAGACFTYDGYGLVQSRYSTDFALRVLDSAHELAHNFDGSHCDYGDLPCRVLCSSLGGCSGGIRSFANAEAVAVRAYIAAYSCFALDTIDVAHATLPFAEPFTGTVPNTTRWTAVDRATVSSGRLQLNHYQGYGSEFYLGTARTLPIVVASPVDVSFRLMPYNVNTGQRLKFEYWNSTRRAWVLLQTFTSPGGISNPWTTVTTALGDSVAGPMFALRWTAYGNSGASGANWYLDDVSIAENLTDAPPPAPRLAAVRPNPSRGPVRVAFTLPSAQRVALEVFDLGGRRVRTLARGAWPAGDHEAAWDALDARGQPVPPGVYLLRLEAAGVRTVLRAVHLR